MKKILKYGLVCILIVQAGWVAGQQTAAVRKKFFADPQMEVNTPWFQKGRAFTTYVEMMEYLRKKVNEHPETASLSVIGKTQKGKEIPAFRISATNGTQPLKVMFTGRVHGDEPGSTEGLLEVIDRLLNDPSLAYLRERLEIVILPMVNVDGGSRLRRVTANGLDMNRDFSKLQTPEAQLLRKFYEDYQPEVVIDFHEFQALRSDYGAISTDNITNPFDAMFLYSGNLNIPEALRRLTADRFVGNARAALDQADLRHHDYFTTDKQFGEVVFSVGGINPRSTANVFALSNSVAILMELRGVHLGKASLKRRVFTLSTLAESYLKTAYDHVQEIKEIIAASAGSKQDIVVKSTPQYVEGYKLPFISMNRNEMIELEVPAKLSLLSTPVLVRERPQAYYILAAYPGIVEKLEAQGIQVGKLQQEKTVEVETYRVVSWKEEYTEFEKFRPVKVKTEVEKKSMTFPAGTYVVPMKQKNGTLAAVLLEPEAPNGFINYRIYETGEGLELPVYRNMNKE